MSWSFDADALIYAAAPQHQLGKPVWEVLRAHPHEVFGSTLLIPEVLIKPARLDNEDEYDTLVAVLARLELIALDDAVAALAVELGAAHGLKPADAVHLASAVWIGADVFVTNNRRDFKPDRIAEIEVRAPDRL
ncbi:MAG: type II toxin-antitoxin system VapC family toxin [Solirubrobacterales bacterium]